MICHGQVHDCQSSVLYVGTKLALAGHEEGEQIDERTHLIGSQEGAIKWLVLMKRPIVKDMF